MKLKLLLLLSIFVISGCSLFSPEVVVRTELVYTKITCPDIPSPIGINMLPVEPKAIFDANKLAWVGLTPQHYGNLGINMQEIIRYIKSQKGQTKYYHDCILSFNVEIKRLQNLENSNE